MIDLVLSLVLRVQSSEVYCSHNNNACIDKQEGNPLFSARTAVIVLLGYI